ncbi:hypothetical protein DI09_34p80 [Mitosporidium daphniae]|uniref:Plus3 domain-containing protein n=1 Tax=Mitosporidium daphniae TaxID=1485682 RepID=A0A098VR10_9MICR|nr:uncharacterized protein DI09_34p80 [Mitosporidium daphniae]KGG51457.1 hypothetical protein DI09_34p80 [Mitosporidium daphniae]|eukprot:XP_013237911.1 uncharacterized protein DI09_34p80 [Mitosporidium daphniae]
MSGNSNRSGEDIKSVSKNILELLNRRASGSDDDEDDDQSLTVDFLEDVEEDDGGSPVHPKKPSNFSRRTKKYSNEEDEIYEDQYVKQPKKSKLSDDELVFSDGYDDDLMGDAIDRERQKKRERWELHRKLQKDKKPIKQPDWMRKTSTIDVDDDEHEHLQPFRADYGNQEHASSIKNFCAAKKEPVVLDDTVELEHILPICLTRSLIEKWLYRSFFKTDLAGFFVRLSLGVDPNRGEQVYRLCQIDSVVEYYKTYTVNASVTKSAFNLRIGKALKKFAIDAISNSPPTQKEFGRWLMELRHSNCYIMRRKEATSLAERVKFLLNSPMTEKEIDFVVKEKRKLNVLKRNPASEKAFLMKERELAIQAGMADEVERINTSLNILNQKISDSNAAGNSRADSMSAIFERNRRINQASADAELERKRVSILNGGNGSSFSDDSLNPFSRRKTVSTYASIVASTTYKEEEEHNKDFPSVPVPSNGGLPADGQEKASNGTEPNSLVKTSVILKENISLDDLEIDIPGI